MPAQKRPLPPPASDEDDPEGRAAVRHATASRGGGGGSGGTDGEVAAVQGSAEPRETRDDDPEDEEEGGGGGGGGDGSDSDSDSESSLSAGTMDERSPAPTWPPPPPSPYSSLPLLPVDHTASRPPKPHGPREGVNHRLARICEPRSYEQKARMPAQKRRLPSPPLKPRDHVTASSAAAAGGGVGGGGGGRPPLLSRAAAKRRRLTDPKPQREDDDSEAEDGGGLYDGDNDSSQSDDGGGGDEFLAVKLADIRKEVQCPICLGIIRKTRTVMECLHRFCRDCIDKSMRLGNNECPACRTHCASRRSLRDDPNYDALIAALYPDIDKYEEEELAFGEEEKTRNKKIQETIEETIRKQSEAVVKKGSKAKATASVFARKYRRNMRRRVQSKTITPDIGHTGSDDEAIEEENADDATKELSSADEHSSDSRQKRGRKRPVSHPSPAKSVGSSDHAFEEKTELVGGKEILATSPLRGEMLAWGKNGTRSQNRHGSAAGSNCRIAKGGRIAKLVDHLRTTDEMDKQIHLYLILLPLDGQSIPNLERPYLSCRPTLSIQHLAQFIAQQLSRQVEELDIYVRIDRNHGSDSWKSSSTGEAKLHPFDGLERLREDKLLSELRPSFTSSSGDLELMYALKTGDNQF